MISNTLTMQTKVAFTATIQKQLLEWTDSEAKSEGKNRSQIVEDALQHFKSEQAKRKIRESYKKMAQDPETYEIEEWGFEDWVNNLPPP